MKNLNTPLLEEKSEWQTPDLEIILTEKTENGGNEGVDGLAFPFTSVS